MGIGEGPTVRGGRTDQGKRERGKDGSEEPKKAYVWEDGGKLAVRVDGAQVTLTRRREGRGGGDDQCDDDAIPLSTRYRS